MDRPECFEFGMEFMGDPEESEIRAYIESLEVDRKVLKISLEKTTAAFNEFISDCLTDDSRPKEPPMKALMRARACLPATCSKTLSKNIMQPNI